MLVYGLVLKWTGKGEGVPEFHADLDGPLVEIVVFVNTNFAGATDLLHVGGEGVTDLGNKSIEFRLPLISKLFDLAIQLG